MITQYFHKGGRNKNKYSSRYQLIESFEPFRIEDVELPKPPLRDIYYTESPLLDGNIQIDDLTHHQYDRNVYYLVQI